MKQALLAILVSNHSGVLSKVTALFSRRGYNIKALSVGETHNHEISRITVLTEGDSLQLEQICKQVRKLEEVLTAEILPEGRLVERELVLVKVRPSPGDVGALMQLVTEFAAKTAAAPNGCAIIEASGSMEQMDRLVEGISRFHILEMSRTGATSLEVSDKALQVEE